MFFLIKKDRYLLKIRVTPNAQKSGVGGIFVDANGLAFLKVALNAQPEKGKANEELIKFLSKKLKVAKTAFVIVSGQTDRYKQIEILIEPHECLTEMLCALENE